MLTEKIICFDNLEANLSNLVRISDLRSLVKNKYTEMYFKYFYFTLSMLQIHLRIYVFYRNTLQLYFWYTKLVYLKSAKLEELILYLMHINRVEVVLKSNYTEVCDILKYV